MRSRYPHPLLLSALIVLTMALAALPYLRAWAKYGSPVYPVRLEVGPYLLWDGFLDPDTVFKRHNQQPVLERYGRYWSEWYTTPVGVDSTGSFGPLFLTVMLAATLLVTCTGLAERHVGWLFIAAVFWLVLVLPEHHVPRYALYMLLPGAAATARLGASLATPRQARCWGTAVLVLVMLNLTITFRQGWRDLRALRSFGIPLLTEARTRPVLDKVRHDGRSGPAPATRRALYGIMQDQETLVSSIGGFCGLLWDYQYRYRVESRHICRQPEDTPLLLRRCDEEQGRAWVGNLHNDGVATAIVYTTSSEDQALGEADSGYRCIYQQPPREKIHGVRIYRRQDLVREDDGEPCSPHPAPVIP